MRRTFCSPAPRALIFLFPASVSIHAQVIIKERVSIDPKSPAPVASSTPSGPLLILDGNTVKTTVPGVILSGSLTISPGTIPNNTGYEVWVNLGGASFLMRKDGTGYCLDTTAQEMNPFPMTLPGCGAIGMSARTFVPAPWVWSCAVREAGLETPQVSGNTATFVANGTLWYTSFTATLTVTASLDESYQPAEVIVSPQSYSLNCNGFTTVTVELLNGRGEPYLPCGNASILATASIAAKGPYAYLEGNGQSGQTIDILISSGQGAFLAVLDTSRGIIPDGSDVGIINVSTQGVIGENAINLTCQYPPPSVAIVYPGQDTTIVLTPTHQPELHLREEHSPATGQFEPSITWDPSDVIVTSDYYAEIADSSVLSVTITAENAGGTATHERKIVLKRACNLPPPRYTQGGTASWADSLYDKSSTGTIAGWGCALSSMAMVMTAFGDTVNPGQLNAWKKERSFQDGGFDGLSVNWHAIEKYSSDRISQSAIHKNQFKNKAKKLLDSTQISNPNVLDNFLTQCNLVIVQVYNDQSPPSRSGQHWVVVTGKEGARYTILDPGSRDQSYLDEYGSFWKYVVVAKKSN